MKPIYAERHTPINLFKKLSIRDQNKVINGFAAYYKGNADDPDKYTIHQLDEEFFAHVKWYGETRLFSDYKLVGQIVKYFEQTMQNKKWVGSYPELFI